MMRYIALGALALFACKGGLKVPRTNVVITTGAAGPALRALSQFLPGGLSIAIPSSWDTLSLTSAMGGVLVDAVPETTASVSVSSYNMPYDTLVHLYVPVDSNGIPVPMTIATNDPIGVLSSQDEVTGKVPTVPTITLTSAPDTVLVDSGFSLAWNYTGGTPDSAMVMLKIGQRDPYIAIVSGSDTSYSVPGTAVDSTGTAVLTVTSISFAGLDGALPGSFVMATNSEFTALIIQ